jgi:hypothetical protein
LFVYFGTAVDDSGMSLKEKIKVAIGKRKQLPYMNLSKKNSIKANTQYTSSFFV